MCSELTLVRRSTLLLVALLFVWTGGTLPVFADAATRHLPDCYYPGIAFSVSITIEPPPGTFSVAAEDQHPPGWTASDLSHSGVWEPPWAMWVFFYDPGTVTVTCNTTPTGDAVGEHCFTAGRVSFDGHSQPIGGDECLVPGPRKGDFDKDCDVDLEDYEMFSDCMAGPDAAPEPTRATAEECLGAFDFDGDDDVDVRDMTDFTTAFTGS